MYYFLIEVLKEILDDPMACIIIGKAYHEKQDFKNCEKYLKMADNHSETYFMFRLLYFKKGNYEQAEKYYLLVFEKIRYIEYEVATIQCGKISYYLGKIYFKADRFSLVEKYLKKVVKKKYEVEAIILLSETYEK
ncbi:MULTISPECIES: hypothetical protein [Fusobacterium]|uniref:hypothetical protein n=1 Tax=Fusobacterium TaxID=848 RepID=UPI0008A2DEED|nr:MULTISPECIES: hypothetical protein [Fusobacterium]OFL92713.1 hypothetical protein HMPREF2747_06850 [Fusobacterium sp. HMSC073F01]